MTNGQHKNNNNRSWECKNNDHKLQLDNIRTKVGGNSNQNKYFTKGKNKNRNPLI